MIGAPATSVSPPSASHVSVKLPHFWPRNVELRTARCEAEFEACSITRQETMLNHLQRNLPDEYAKDLCDLLIQRPSKHPYDKLKETLAKRVDCVSSLLVKNWATENLLSCRGGCSNLLTSENSGLQFSVNLSFQRLPLDVQTVLAVSQGGIEELAELADKVILLLKVRDDHETDGGVPSVSVTTASSLQAECAGFTTSSESMVSPTPAESKRLSSFCLTAANCSIIPTFGQRSVKLDLGLRRIFGWVFIIAGISVALIGADFLTQFNLLVDLKNRRLVDSLINLRVRYAPLSLMTDASSAAVGVSLQQTVSGVQQPLAFFSKKLSSAETRNSGFGRGLLAVYLAVRRLRHFLEGREFVVLTDHKPLVSALRASSDRYSPNEVHHLHFISQFSCDIKHVDGKENVVADALLRIKVNSVTSNAVDFTLMADPQRTDDDLSHYRHTDSSPILRDAPLPTEAVTITFDTSCGRERPFVPATTRRQVFDVLHGLFHHGVRATVKLITDRFVWPNINRDIWRWTRSCLACQRAKIYRHTVTSSDTFTTPDTRLSHVHTDLLKTALMAQSDPSRWSSNLPLVMLSLRSTIKADIGCTAADLVYETSLRLPGELVSPSETLRCFKSCSCVNRLHTAMRTLRAMPTRVSPARSFIPPNLDTCDFVLVRHDAVRRPLQPPYDGPYKVLRRSDKHFVIERNGKTDTVSIDRVKPAYLDDCRSTLPQPSSPAQALTPTPPSDAIPPPMRRTRSGRHVRWPDRFVAG
ncbi:hypothetical protein SprV_0602129500 [Sparganum proliferum]